MLLTFVKLIAKQRGQYNILSGKAAGGFVRAGVFTRIYKVSKFETFAVLHVK